MQVSTLCVAKRTRSVRKGIRRGAPHDSCDDRSLRSSVGMQVSTLCVAKRTRSVRKGMRRGAPHEIVAVIVPHAPVGMHFVTLRVTATCCIGLDRNLCGSELAHEDFGPNAIFPGAAPASSRASSLPRRLCITLSAEHAGTYRSSRSGGNAGLDAPRRQEDAERPERHATRSAAR
ncbi:hypothetical protein SAMN05444062_108196 [Pseudomonas syringae]|nr:hypothetical protein [Pseudomonas sp. PvP009]SFH60028.1 hypothetical protein SAMN05444062_108196 [Pseudomonas syringae]